jgi:thiamine pyrophosphate-dependent acetolactate synthase large subunit-like protein
MTGMPVVAALQVLVDQRREGQIVVTNQGSARIWPRLCSHPLDFHYNPSTMGGAVPLAVGLALAQREREVLCVTGDGALLMSLGSLATAAGAGVSNLTVVVLNNGLYEVTGGQETPAAGRVDFAALARAAGFASAERFSELLTWQQQAAAALAAPGPRCIALDVQPAPPEFLSGAPRSIADQVAQFRAALGVEPGRM